MLYDDAKATLNVRNAYFNRNFTYPSNPQAKAEEWTQNFILDAKSGYTRGTVGFGIDVLGLYSQKLDGGKGTAGKEWGRESELAYTVQSAVLKNLNVRWRNSTMRRDFSNNEFDENRVFISYPISLS